MERKKYYFNAGTSEISQIPYGNNTGFVIFASEAEVIKLRSLMDQMHAADMRSFFRSHVPIVPYHNDQPNDDHSVSLTEAFKLVYELGSDETKAHIKDMGVLGDHPL